MSSSHLFSLPTVDGVELVNRIVIAPMCQYSWVEGFPRWTWHAAAHFGARVKAHDQYLRSHPRQFRDFFDSGQ